MPDSPLSLFLSRLDFAWVTTMHIIYPPLTIGLAILLFVAEWRWMATGNEGARVVMGKGSGIDSINMWLQEAGMQVSDEDALKITQAVKVASLKTKKLLTKSEFTDIAKRVIDENRAA